MEITAALVKELRERTGAGMMDCKRALQEADGDIEAAIESMRKSGMAKAAKKAGRVAAEGAIVLRQEGSAAVLVEVNSETDFVAKDANFLAFADAVAETVMAAGPADVPALLETTLAGQDVTVEEARQQLVAKLGENISVRRFSHIDTGSGSPGAYVHGGRIGVLVDLSGGDAELAKDLAMHIAASNPVCVSEAEVDGKLLEREREVYAAQAAETGKPPEIVEKMVQGRLQKFLKEITLLGQPFVKDTEQTVGKLLKDKGAEVRSFVRLEVGEGIEKKSDNFAEEVMAQARRD